MHSPADTSSHTQEPGSRVASITVTYNGAASIRRHLQSLRAQTHRLHEIVVVDNASSDDTRRLVADEFPEVTLVELGNNVGVAGGLAAGINYAVQKKQYDWIWTFDQDSVPAPDALEQLLTAFDDLSPDNDSVALLAPTCRHSSSGMSYPALSWLGSGFAPSELPTAHDVDFVDMVISSGSLIRSSVVDKVGLPREDFFIDFVDYEYCLRLRKYGFRIALVRDAVLEHSIGSPAMITFLGTEKSWADHASWREYYMARNEIFTIWQYRPFLATKFFVLRRLAQHALGILLFGSEKLACLTMICRGVIDGLTGRLGIRYLPHQSRTFETVAHPLRPASLVEKSQ